MKTNWAPFVIDVRSKWISDEHIRIIYFEYYLTIRLFYLQC